MHSSITSSVRHANIVLPISHNKADCTNPRVEREFTGECRNCGETGHRKADCPTLPAQTCKICKQEGHIATECTANRMFNDATISRGIAEMSLEDAWTKVEIADKEQDVDMIKEVSLFYAPWCRLIGVLAYQ